MSLDITNGCDQWFNAYPISQRARGMGAISQTRFEVSAGVVANVDIAAYPEIDASTEARRNELQLAKSRQEA